MSNGRDISNMKEGQVAKAWVLFNGQNNNLTTAYNVTSVTDVGATAGQYNINFENDMPSDDYIILSSNTTITDGRVATPFVPGGRSTSSCAVYVLPSYSTISYINATSVHVAIFGGES